MTASNENYTCTDRCDSCGKTREGTMFHAEDAMGIPTPVLFTCFRCQHPTALDKLVRKARYWARRVRYYATTTRSERAEARARTAKIRARIEARRAAK